MCRVFDFVCSSQERDNKYLNCNVGVCIAAVSLYLKIKNVTINPYDYYISIVHVNFQADLLEFKIEIESRVNNKLV